MLRPSYSAVAVAIMFSLIGCSENDSSNNGIIPVQNSSGNNTPAPSSSTGSVDSNSVTVSNNAQATNITPAAGTTANGTKNYSRIFQTYELKSTTIKTPGGDLKLWIMDDESKRQEGMMFLHDNEVKDNEGMLFLFPDVQKLSGNYAFWMKNTVLPLDIDYISKEKRVLNIGKGVSFSEAPVKPKGDYFYVIEVKQGLSARFGLTPGAKVEISNDLKGKP